MSQQALPNKSGHVIIRGELRILTGFPQISLQTTTGHARSPELQHLRVYKQLRTTGGVPHANYQLLVAVPICRNRLGNLLERQSSQQSSGSTQKLKKVQYFGNPWAHQCLQKPVVAILFIQYSLASFPSDYLCRILTRRFYLATRKMSRPYGSVFQLG